ncbi:MAG: hypothetical protein ACJA0T_001801 [Colwellia sp.]|jgi:hypothetical protein
MASRFILPFADVGSGIKPSSGARLFFYETATNTFKNTFSDQLATTPNANPVIADSSGVFSNIFIDGTYKVILQNFNGTQIWEADPVSSSITSSDLIQTQFEFINAFKVSTSDLPLGKKVNVIHFYENGEAIEDLNYLIVTGTADGFVNHQLASGRMAQLIQGEQLNLKQCGVVGDGSTDDYAAAQGAIDFIKTSGLLNTRKLRFPSNILLSQSLDYTSVGALRYEVLGGDDIASTRVFANYNGYGSAGSSPAVFAFGDEAAPAYQTGVGVNGFLFLKGPLCTRAPIAIQGSSLAQSRINNITNGEWNNTVLSLNTPQNCRGNNITNFGGGLSFAYKDASAITVTRSGTTVTSTGAIFSAADVGKTIAIWGTDNDFRSKTKVVTFTNSTTVDVSDSITDGTARNLFFGSPFASMTSGSADLTADASTFTADHVGLVLWVKGAGANSGLLRAKIITFTSATQVTLDTVAGATTAAGEFCVACNEIYSSSAFSNGASDNRFYGLQVESHNGVGLCVYDSDILHIEGKIHSEQTINESDYSLSTIWADRWAGSFYGDWDAQYIGEHRSWFGNNTSSLHINNLSTRSARNENIIHIGLRSATFEGACIVIDNLAISGDLSTSDLRGTMITDENTAIPGYALVGSVTRNAFDLSAFFVGRSAYSDDSGNFVANSISFDGGGNALNAYTNTTSFTPVISDAVTGGNLATGTLSGSYERIGNVVVVSLDLRSINTTGMTGGNNLYIRGLPIPVKGGATSRYASTLRVDNVVFAGYLTAYADNADDYFLIYDNTSGNNGALVTVSDLTSGSANIYLTCTYFANLVS